ncbi:MAG: NAD(P)H:quinone oxidoreductase, type IV [Bdellovibrionales bacterium RIFOXYB1_FULL_37_110]|nr:MAG: NAD(P)H:quinone oxidoreductase, type IV [Bdellovibrionales bacterium RIFOXYC1_FULL_37_79]OFZ60857.1 MAG: NAD(P)H:quinone oxidoreductase, type IV [Bdellovibrionales bacterium RIFOXYB1_FULL_37_110]OFZ62387.1 MAG: NAD(P)H:quinone oxidoreductase, type IV [Bdellovibrionales bacterium RIFOXYD1_FULL_36_51]
MKILVVYYSMYGHIHAMANAVAEGVLAIDGAEVMLRRVPETLSNDVLKKMNALDAQKEMAHIPICRVDELSGADAIIFGTPTRFGNMCGQMSQFWDATGQLWIKGGLVGKVGAVFTSSATQHGGQESTLLGFHTTLLHHGFIVVGLPYSYHGQMETEIIAGNSPYGASTIAGSDGSRKPNKSELDGARYLGTYVTEITQKLIRHNY